VYDDMMSGDPGEMKSDGGKWK